MYDTESFAYLDALITKEKRRTKRKNRILIIAGLLLLFGIIFHGLFGVAVVSYSSPSKQQKQILLYTKVVVTPKPKDTLLVRNTSKDSSVDDFQEVEIEEVNRSDYTLDKNKTWVGKVLFYIKK